MGLAADGQPRRRLRADVELVRLPGRDLRVHRPARAVARCTPATATVLCLIIAFPLAYFMAFKAGRWRNLMLLLIILPFFTSLIVRTVAWQTILTDDGWVVTRCRRSACSARTAACSRRGRRDRRHHLQLPAVHGAAALRVAGAHGPPAVEAATDLYASRWTAFRKVTLPLAAPGIFAGTLLDLHPRDRRLHQRPAARHAEAVHDRQRHPVAVPRGARLPDGGGALVRRDGVIVLVLDRDRRAAPGHEAPAGGGGRMRTPSTGSATSRSACGRCSR